MEVTGSPWNGYPCPRMLCLDTPQTMDCSVRLEQDRAGCAEDDPIMSWLGPKGSF